MRNLILASAALILAAASNMSSLSAAVIAPGLYELQNHPASGGYGLRLDELIDVSAANDVFQFDFDHPNSTIQMEYVHSPWAVSGTIRIFGVVHGGLVNGGALNQNYTTDWNIDFTYSNIRLVSGDDDLRYNGANTPSRWGSISGTPGAGAVSFDLSYKPFVAGDVTPVLRIGNRDDDLGHLGFNGVSGWGKLAHVPDGADNWHTGDNSEWLFVAVPEASAFWAGGLLAVLAAASCLSQRRKAVSAA